MPRGPPGGHRDLAQGDGLTSLPFVDDPCQIWEYGSVKTTLEISDTLFRKVKVTAAQRRQTMKQFVSEALQEKLGNAPSKPSSLTPGWLKYFGMFGKTARMRTETRRIQKLIDEEFENLDFEDA